MESELINELTEAAYDLSQKEFSHQELITFLESDNQQYKYISLLKLDTLLDNSEAYLLVSNLVDNETSVRDMASQRIKEFLADKNLNLLFQQNCLIPTILRGITDINPRVCNNVIDALPHINNKELILENIFDSITGYIELINESKAEANHYYHKNVFKVYWFLEALTVVISHLKQNLSAYEPKFIELAQSLYRKEEYTIREKVAQLVFVLSKFEIKSKELDNIINELKNDSNFYVRRILNPLC